MNARMKQSQNNIHDVSATYGKHELIV